MNRITYLAAAGALVATSGLGAWAANAATTDTPATHVRTTDRPGADDTAGHHRHHGADDIVRHHRHAAHDTARHSRHGEPEPGDDHGGLTTTPEPDDDHGGNGELEPGDDHGGDDGGHHGGDDGGHDG